MNCTNCNRIVVETFNGVCIYCWSERIDKVRMIAVSFVGAKDCKCQQCDNYRMITDLLTFEKGNKNK